jgi:WD40 repeat protein
MEAKFVPHSSGVTAISFSRDGRVILSGSKNGLLIVSSGTTGMTLRALSDHKGSAILGIEVSTSQDGLWLAVSSNSRMSVWQSDWSKDQSDLVDWVALQPESSRYCHSRALFSPANPALVLYSCETSNTVHLIVIFWLS